MRHIESKRLTHLQLERLEDRLVPSNVPNDQLFNRSYHHDLFQSSQAWQLTTGDARVVVADVDTGLDYTHPDLFKNVWLNQAEIPVDVRARLTDTDADGIITFWDLNVSVNQGPGKIADLNGTGFIDGGDVLRTRAQGGWADGADNGANGYVDDLLGWDFVDNDNDPMDLDGHGTLIAGNIGAIGNNDVGVTGVNWKVSVMPLRFYAFAGPQIADPVPSIYYAVDNGARVSNHSYALPANVVPDALVAAAQTAIEYADSRGHLLVAAAGNFATDADAVLPLPAAFDVPNILSVSATDKHDRLADFSNWGATVVDLAAPGVEVWSTYIHPGQGYVRWLGTSASSPFVAGATALLWARNPSLTVADVRQAILSTVDPLEGLAAQSVSGGRLNVARALRSVPAAGWGEFSVGAPTGHTATGYPGPWEASGKPMMSQLAKAGSISGPPSLSIGDVRKKEGQKGLSAFTFVVTLSAPASNTVTVNFATAESSPGATYSAGEVWDYQAVSGTLTFAPGETWKTITVSVIGDRLLERDETFSVLLSGAVNATITDALGIGTILDDGDNLVYSGF